MENNIHASIVCNLDADILSAAIPLFEQEKVAGMEWSFDALFHKKELPPWFEALVEAYSDAGRLIGHGVFFSLFSGKWLPEQDVWLKQLEALSGRFHFDHVTEHFGFMTGADFHNGAPLSLPYTPVTLAIGVDRLKRIYDAVKCPVGLENLAFSYSLEQVKLHGDFLNELLEPVNGFIILDLHNLYCQLHNFNIAFEDVIKLYPLERVREIHISGGSWEADKRAPLNKVRRDTHDSAVPDEVFDLLRRTLRLCPQLKYVVMEQLGAGLKTKASKLQFQTDFMKMDEIISSFQKDEKQSFINSFLPLLPIHLGKPIEDAILYQEQLELSEILETAKDYETAMYRLKGSGLMDSAWDINSWQPYMVSTALHIVQKWKKK